MATPKEKDLYIAKVTKHVQMVKEAFEQQMVPVLGEFCETVGSNKEELLQDIRELLNKHDKSKFGGVELNRYAEKYANGEEEGEGYDYAWNHHQKQNRHHWQYWVLINDESEPQLEPLPIPLKYICEMLCDWSAAAHYYDGNGTANKWYEKQKGKMILHDETRKIIEGFLVLLGKEF